MTHRTPSSEACSLAIMLGIAMFTIVRSSRVMKNPSDMTIRTAHGLPRYLITLTKPLLVGTSRAGYLPAYRPAPARPAPGKHSPRSDPGAASYSPSSDLAAHAPVLTDPGR